MASRLEQLCKRYRVEIIVSLATFEMVAAHFCARVLDIVVLTGKTQATVILHLMCRRAAASESQLRLKALSFKLLIAYQHNDLEQCRELVQEMLMVIPDDVALSIVKTKILEKATITPTW